ncbi:hypothetical protein C6542_08785 [Escherichia coli]|nr:hypothetical protein [Escherichia coli]EFO0164609.1 hypothetical protein [Escherichia coli]EFO0168300.1 hypothetical protein [Escherichia coli]EFO0199427.1 hypothetical protein [Escherichia coli]EFO0203869.1 hypothetical protein [Escherichia coli]
MHTKHDHTFLKLYLIYMFKVKTLNAGIKEIFNATLREIDLAQFWRQRSTAREVLCREKGDENRH